MAILGVLLNILGIINIQGSQTAPNTAKEKMKEAYNNVGTPKNSGKIQVVKDDVITSRNVVGDGLGLPIERVCLGVADSLSDTFDVTETAINYTGSRTIDAKVVALCWEGDDLVNYIQSDFPSWDIATVECGNDAESDPNTSCFVGIIRN